MICFRHEKTNINLNASRSKPSESFSFCSENPGSIYRYKDSRLIADIGGAATGMDNPGIRLEATGFESVDAQSKRERIRSFKTKTQAGTSLPIRPENRVRTGETPGKVASRFWYKSVSMGWSNTCASSGTLFWDKDKGTSGSKLASSVRLSVKASKLFLPPGSKGRCQKISKGVKKNFKILKLMRLLFLKMKQVLLCILGWGEDGRRLENVCVFPPIASIIRGSTYLAGLLLFWGGLV